MRTFRDKLLQYANSWWGQRIFIWSSVAILVAAIVFVTYLGVGIEGGGGAASSKFVSFLTFLLAIPSIIVFNLALALAWAIAASIVSLFRG